MKIRKSFRADLATVALALLFGAALAALLLLVSCTGADAAAGPSADEKAVTGSWAGQVDAEGVALLLSMRLEASKAYQVEIQAAGELVERERGAWRAAAGRVYFTPESCDQVEDVGGPLRPVTCEPGDDIPVNIAGDTWTLHFPAGGELVSFELKRL